MCLDKESFVPGSGCLIGTDTLLQNEGIFYRQHPISISLGTVTGSLRQTQKLLGIQQGCVCSPPATWRPALTLDPVSEC